MIICVLWKIFEEKKTIEKKNERFFVTKDIIRKNIFMLYEEEELFWRKANAANEWKPMNKAIWIILFSKNVVSS